MQSKVVVPIGDPRLMDISVYISTTVMALLGVSSLPTLTLQAAALALCLAFALVYRFLFRTGIYERQPAMYFGTQALLIVLLFLLKSEASDAFNFLFYTLTIQAAVVLPLRTAIAWTGLYYLISSTVVLLSRGADGMFAVFFYLGVFVVCVLFGHALQQSALTGERNKRLVSELQETQQKLRELAVVEERNRLARDLHDSVKQQVFAISMQLSAARTSVSPGDDAYEPLAAAEQLARQAGMELTSLINALRPPALESRTLADAIREHVEAWSRQTGIPADMDIAPTDGLDPQVEQALFRVLQEALANVGRHSRARRAAVTLEHDPGEVRLTVEDDGIGYQARTVPKGIGMESMRERLAGVDGDLEIMGRPSGGTRLAARVRRA